MTLPLPLQAKVLDALAQQMAPSLDEAALSPDRWRTEVQALAHAQGLPATADQIEATVQQLLGENPSEEATTVAAWDRPKTARTLAKERQQIAADLATWTSLNRTTQTRSFLRQGGTMLGGMVLGTVIYHLAYGHQPGMDMSTAFARGGMVGTVIGAILSFVSAFCWPGRYSFRQFSQRVEAIEAATVRQRQTAPVIPETDQLARWERIPALADHARTCLRSPVGLLQADVDAIEAAYQRQEPLLRRADQSADLTRFLQKDPIP